MLALAMEFPRFWEDTQLRLNRSRAKKTAGPVLQPAASVVDARATPYAGTPGSSFGTKRILSLPEQLA